MNTAIRKEFESLHKEYLPMVYNLCKGFVKGDNDLASDLSQEVFINVWNGLPKFKRQSSIKTWIYRICVNTCLKYFRNIKEEFSLIDEIHSNNAEDDQVNIKQQNETKLYTAISTLKETDRLIIMMVLEELKYEEIAKVMGISTTNLRVKIHRIKQQLKKQLER